MKHGKSMFLFMSAGTGAGDGVGIARIIIPDHITAADPGPVDTVAVITDHAGNNNKLKGTYCKESPRPVVPYLFFKTIYIM